jgi:hypothetical protein
MNCTGVSRSNRVSAFRGIGPQLRSTDDDLIDAHVPHLRGLPQAQEGSQDVGMAAIRTRTLSSIQHRAQRFRAAR